MATPAKRSRQPLAQYWAKRDFARTPEPRGRVATPRTELAYYIQRHHARRLHYDFRLELDGTLKSWAIPKGPSLDPADKRLAVHVEDHPLDYGTFEGEIPPHQYGAGKVLLWDRGVWTPLGDPRRGLRAGHLKFELKGRKLAGRWALVRMGEAGDKENWLLIKEHDDAARTGSAAAITERRPESVLGVPPDEASAAAAAPRRGKLRAAAARKTLAGAERSAMPAFIKPQLATLADRPPAIDDWLLEVKFDGYRALCRLERGAARLYTRAGHDWTAKWRAIAAQAATLPVAQAWIDGEVVALDEHGAVRFQLLQNMERDGAGGRLAYYAFDLLYLDGHDLRALPLLQRKELLRELLAPLGSDGPILYSEHVVGDADTIFAHACRHGLEGLIAKRPDARYESTRSRSWLKVKCLQRQEFVIGAYSEPAGSREQFGALLLGVYDDNGGLRYAGKVGTGFDAATLKSVAREFPQRRAAQPPFVDPPTGAEARGVHWLTPTLVAEVKFAEWTGSGHIRHGVFIGLRSDKRAEDIRRERAVPAAQAVADERRPRRRATANTDRTAAHARTTSRSRSTSAASATASAEPAAVRGGGVAVAGVPLSNPDRVLYPEMGLTKLELARYYEDVADWILPHVVGRPLTLVRCPDGVKKQCFYQKHINDTLSKHLTRIDVAGSKKPAAYMAANSLPALIALTQMGVLELHTWGARKPRLDKPDRIIFDLDPAPDLAWRYVIEAAQLLRGLLEELGLASFVKTTGGKGLHVAVPIKADKTWDEIKPFSRAIAVHMANELPERFTAKLSKSSRTGKIFIDYLRNGYEATAVAAYSTRARTGAPVSVPLAWDELSEQLRSDTYNVANARERLQNLPRDPWQDYFEIKQQVSAALLRRYGVR